MKSWILALLLAGVYACAGTAVGPETTGAKPPTAPEWAMEGANPARTSRTHLNPPKRWDVRRFVALGDERGHEPEEYSTPIVIDGVAYVGHSHRAFEAVRLADGERLWSVKTEGRVFATAAYVDGVLIFGDDQGLVRALTLEGAEVWRFRAPYPVVSSPVAAAGRVYVGVADQNVFCLEVATGRPLWQYGRRFPRDVGLWRSLGLCYANDVLYAGFADGTVVALEGAVGRVIWRLELTEAQEDGGISAGPVFEGGRLYIGTLAGMVACIEAAEGKELWRSEKPVASGFAVGDEFIYAGTPGGGVFALSRQDGQPVWEAALDGGLPSPPTLAGDVVLVGTSKGGLYGLDGFSGKVLGRYQPGPGVRSQPTVFEQGTLLLSNEASLHWLR